MVAEFIIYIGFISWDFFLIKTHKPTYRWRTSQISPQKGPWPWWTSPTLHRPLWPFGYTWSSRPLGRSTPISRVEMAEYGTLPPRTHYCSGGYPLVIVRNHVILTIVAFWGHMVIKTTGEESIHVLSRKGQIRHSTTPNTLLFGEYLPTTWTLLKNYFIWTIVALPGHMVVTTT